MIVIPLIPERTTKYAVMEKEPDFQSIYGPVHSDDQREYFVMFVLSFLKGGQRMLAVFFRALLYPVIQNLYY